MAYSEMSLEELFKAYPEKYHLHMKELEESGLLKEGGRLLWFNPELEKCAECHFWGWDELVSDHIRKYHPELYSRSRVKLLEKKWLEEVARIPDNAVRCPFCLTGQTMRQMLFPTANGEMSKRRRCMKCGRSMTLDSAVAFSKGTEHYARWVAAYASMGFWQTIDRDEFHVQLAILHDKKEIDKFEFWKAYRAVKPKPNDWNQDARKLLDEAEKKKDEAKKKALAAALGNALIG